MRGTQKQLCNLYLLRPSTVQYSTVQYSTVQYSTIQYSTVQYNTLQYSKFNDQRELSPGRRYSKMDSGFSADVDTITTRGIFPGVRNSG